MNVKAILNEDRIIKLSTKVGVDILSPFPSGVGFERIRVVDGHPIDLADLTEIWVRHLDGTVFELHAMEVPNSQLVDMTYADRRDLSIVGGVIGVMTKEEITDRADNEFNTILKNKLRSDMSKVVGDLADQADDNFTLLSMLLDYVISGDIEVLAALQEVKTMLDGVYDTTKTKDKLLVVVGARKDYVVEYDDKKIKKIKE